MTRFTALPLVSLLLVACTAGAPATPSPSPSPTPSPTPSPSPSPSPAPAGLDGRNFVFISIEGPIVLVPNTQLRIGFQNGNLSASAGCNSISGSYSLDGNILVVGNLGMTEMACDPPALMQQEQWFVQLLGSRPTLALDGDTLTITSGDVVIKLVDRQVAEPDLPLAGTLWTVNSIITGDAVSSVPQGATATIQFDENGGVTFNDGCNSGGGKYTVDGSTITFSDLVSTDMACAGPAGQLAAAVVAVLSAEGGIEFAIDSSSLTLTAGQAGLILQGAAVR